MTNKGVVCMLSVVLLVSVMTIMTSDVLASSKGLKVYLDVQSNQQGQACIDTHQFGRLAADCIWHYINQGHTATILTYERGQIQSGEFQICVKLNDGLQNCGNGYNSEAKKPEYVSVNLQRQFTPVGNNNADSQSQSSSNENNNALSQSQETKIYICNDEGCKIQ